MLPGSFSVGDVSYLETYVVVNGVSRAALTVSLDREMAGDLPEQVVSGGGIAGGSGSITWASEQDVQTREDSPWHKVGGWPPSAGDRVQVYATDGVTSWPRFSGVIDKTTGTVGGGMQSTIIDDRDRLNAVHSHEALLRHHVPFAEDGEYRSIGLNYWHALTAALRRARVFNLPPAVAEIGVSAPMQGSVWPEFGTLTAAIGEVVGNHATFYEAPWGYSAGGFAATYTPRTSFAPTEPMQITLLVGAEHSESATVDVKYGAYSVRVNALSTRDVIAYRDGIEICRLTAAQMDGATTVCLLVKGGTWTIRNDKGHQGLAGAGPLSSAPMETVQVNAAAGARVAGIQVSRPNTSANEFDPLTFTPSMRFVPGYLASTMDMSPRIENRNVSELVDEICKSTLTAGWWDESGVFNLVPAERLYGGNSTQTITTLDNIIDLSWEDSLLSVRSAVEVTWSAPSISKGRHQRKELFRGSGDSLASKDIVEVIAVPDGDTEWFGIDRSVAILTSANWSQYNSRRGSFTGYFFSTDSEETSDAGLTMTIATTPIGSAGLKISHLAGTYPSTVEANLATSPTASTLWAYLRNQNLPVIRGFGEGKWVDAVHTSTITGPAYAPALSHDLGKWGHGYFDGDTVARRIADFIAQQVTSPAPTITGMGVIYDPRRQLGDVITIQSGLLDITLSALVIGISESHAAGDHTQELSVRIISATSTRQYTYAELEEAWSGGNYAGLEAVWAVLNYTDFTNEPLEGAPNT